MYNKGIANGEISQTKHATLVALNAQYIHTPAGISSIAAFVGDKYDLECLSFNINENFESILYSIYHNRSAVVCFSCYIWNIEIVYNLAQSLHAMDESVEIFLGGPEVSYDPIYQLEERSYISGVFCKEGEQSFLSFLGEYYGSKNYSNVLGFCYRQGDKIINNELSGLLSGKEIPVAYDFDNLPKHPQIIYYESSRGCPYRCAFCLSRGEKLRLRPIEDTLNHLRKFVDNGAKQVKLLDRSFNADLERAKKIWVELSLWDTNCNFHFEIAPEALDDEAIRILNNAPKDRFQFEIGVQSTNQNTKKAIDRNEDFEKIKSIVVDIQKGDNIHLHLDLIAGLPEEDFTSFGQSFRDVFSLMPDMLQLGFLKLLKGSHLRDISDEFGCKYSSYPPYEVRRTNSINASEIFVLKQCEKALDAFYHTEYINRATLYLLDDGDSFEFFCELGQYIEDKKMNAARNKIQAIWDFALKRGKQRDGLKELLTFDYLKIERSPVLPLDLPELGKKDKDKLRLFYQTQGASLFPKARGNPWRFCQVQKFEYDILNFVGSGSIQKLPNYILFDYQNQRQLDISEFFKK